MHMALTLSRVATASVVILNACGDGPGAAKSSLLSAALGLMQQVAGSPVTVAGRVAFVPQVPDLYARWHVSMERMTGRSIRWRLIYKGSKEIASEAGRKCFVVIVSVVF